MKNNKEYALQYAQLGLHVLPLKPNEKRPLPGGHGVHDATTNTEQINQWWDQYPDAGIGIAMGKVSGVFAVDIDPRNDGDISLEQLIAENSELPHTVMAITGGNGLHYVFKYPDSGEIPKQVLMDGIDIISDNAYIVVEPSIHRSGKEYVWEGSSDPLEGKQPCAAPEWLLDKLVDKRQTSAANDPVHSAANDPVHSSVSVLPTYIPENLFDDIRSALKHIPSDDYKTWTDIGMSLKSLGLYGYAIWNDWSKTSAKYDPTKINYKWESFTANKINGLSYQTIFHKAQENGWKNPRANKISLPYPCTTLDEIRLANLKWDQLTPPEVDYLITDKIPMATTGLIAGTGASSKTQFILQLCCGVAAGAPTFSQGSLQPPWIPQLPREVLILTAEESKDDLWRRIHNIAAQSKYTDQQMNLMRVNLHIHSVSGLDNLFTKRSPEGEYHKTQNVEDLLELVKQMHKPGLIVFEPIARFRSGDENNNEAGTRLVEIMELISNETDATVLTASHTNKGTSSAEELNQDAIRGASALVDGVRWAAVMRVMTTDEARKYGIDENIRLNYVQFVIPKANNITPQTGQWFMRGRHGFLQLTTLIKSTNCKADKEYETVLKRVIKFIKKHPNKYSIRKLENEHAGKSGLFKIGQKSLRGIISRAIEEEKLVQNEKNLLAIPDEKAEDAA